MGHDFDIAVIGGGHAGIEAAVAAATMGCRTVLLTMDPASTGRMSCNPAIGGTAKGHLVKEIDALGGSMGLIADRSGIQFKMLNASKGPSVWSPRCQNDRDAYSLSALEIVHTAPGLSVQRGTIEALLLDGDRVVGFVDGEGKQVACRRVIICSGTFLNAVMHTGLEQRTGGRYEEPASTHLSDMLRSRGLKTGRLKTGTPPRVALDTIDLSATERNPGDDDPQPFSMRTKSVRNQIDCYITHTNERTHAALALGFEESPMFTGRITGVGPRYCPSIEDKLVRFPDRNAHHLFLEPEGVNSNVVYVNGFSTSLPATVQLAALRTVAGLENVEMIRPGYAVEYDYFPPHQLHATMESKHIAGLYFAGQVNGTSGYEEAAAQGLMAGINAALAIHEQPPFVLRRSEAYIGVLIDDLVTKSTNEPYRMFTSLAEHRLVLRQDNADLRLSAYGHRFGLLPTEYHNRINDKRALIEQARALAAATDVTPAQVNDYLRSLNEQEITGRTKLNTLIRRQRTTAAALFALTSPEAIATDDSALLLDALRQVDIDLKYEGYFRVQHEMIARAATMEGHAIPASFDYSRLRALSSEAREKLAEFRPASIGQASRISGVSPADISVLLIALRS
jgi:tRNA uridine 5-carboxymethylaminomethyl modification enzyme